MTIPIVNSRDLPNTWRILDDKLGNFRNRGLPFKFPYIGAFSQHLAEWFICVYSKPGEIVFDPFSGRGTVAMQSLWHDRHAICNDLSPYSSTLCHSVLWPPYMHDVYNYLNILEEYILMLDNKIDTNYTGKGSVNDVAKLYHPDTFIQIIKLRNLLNSKALLLGSDIFTNKLKCVDNKRGVRYNHEIVMFIRMAMSQCLLHSNADMGFNGIKTRGTDNTSIKAILKYYQSMGEIPKKVNIFDRIRSYVSKTDLDGMGIRDKFVKLNRNLISCDARKISLPNMCIDMILTSPPYFNVLSYGKSNWLRLWSIENIGDPLIKSNSSSEIMEKDLLTKQEILEQEEKDVDKEIEKINDGKDITMLDKLKDLQIRQYILKNESSEIYGRLYDKATGSTGSTVANPTSYSAFTGQYLRELYRILKDDGVAIIVVGDYGNKGKVDAWRIVKDRAEIFGFKPQMIIMDELNKDVKSSTQFNLKQGGGKNDYDVCVVLYKGKYELRNDPENIDFRWGAKFVDGKQLDIVSAWG